MMDAYRRARVVKDGCNHQLGCKCESPFWLRLPTAIEEETQEWYRGVRRHPEQALPVARTESPEAPAPAPVDRPA